MNLEILFKIATNTTKKITPNSIKIGVNRNPPLMKNIKKCSKAFWGAW